jgi:DNA repair protein RadC
MRLLEEFGSVSEVLSAPIGRLTECRGIGIATALHLTDIFRAALFVAAERVDGDKPVLSSSRALQDYCRLQMAFLPVEQFRVLFLDKRNRLIADEVQQTGTVDHTPVYPREVLRRCLELSATALILVHNHPSGDPTPSAADLRMTSEIEVAAKLFGIILHDHLIVGKERCISIRVLLGQNGQPSDPAPRATTLMPT